MYQRFVQAKFLSVCDVRESDARAQRPVNGRVNFVGDIFFCHASLDKKATGLGENRGRQWTAPTWKLINVAIFSVFAIIEVLAGSFVFDSLTNEIKPTNRASQSIDHSINLSIFEEISVIKSISRTNLGWSVATFRKFSLDRSIGNFTYVFHELGVEAFPSRC